MLGISDELHLYDELTVSAETSSQTKLLPPTPSQTEPRTLGPPQSCENPQPVSEAGGFRERQIGRQESQEIPCHSSLLAGI